MISQFYYLKPMFTLSLLPLAWLNLALASNYDELFDDDYPGVNSEQTREACYTKILVPCRTAYDLIRGRVLENVSNAHHDVQLDDPLLEIPPFNENSIIVSQLATTLSQKQIDDIGLVLELFNNLLTYEQLFFDAYNAQVKSTQTTTLVSVSSIVAALLAAIPSTIAQLAQGQCTSYSCEQCGYGIIVTPNSGDLPDHYCGKLGTDYDCLTFLVNDLGYNALVNVPYLANCSPTLNPALIGSSIPIGRVSQTTNSACVALLASLPYLPSALALLPGLYTVGTWLYRFWQLKGVQSQFENTLKTKLKINTMNFAYAIEEITQFATEIADILMLAGSVFKITGMSQSQIAQAFEQNSVHQNAAAMLQRSSFIGICKTAAKDFCCYRCTCTCQAI